MGEFAELIERLEKADGASRDLDAAIYVATIKGAYPDETVEDRLKYARHACYRYTASLDAALTLVPDLEGEKLDWLVGFDDDVPVATIHRQHQELAWQPGSTPAIALCIAALKVRASDKAGDVT